MARPGLKYSFSAPLMLRLISYAADASSFSSCKMASHQGRRVAADQPWSQEEATASTSVHTTTAMVQEEMGNADRLSWDTSSSADCVVKPTCCLWALLSEGCAIVDHGDTPRGCFPESLVRCHLLPTEVSTP